MAWFAKTSTDPKILSLVRELRTPVGASRRDALTRERQDLVKEIRRIHERLAEISREIGPAEDGCELIEGHVEAAD